MPALTTVHEIGHVIDDMIFGAMRGTGTRLPGSLAYSEALLPLDTTTAYNELFYAINSSKSIRHLEGALPLTQADMDMAAYINYLLRKPEMFARAYAQYVTVQSSDAMLASQVASGSVPADRWIVTAWPAQEFGPIGSAIEKLLKIGGLVQ